MTTMSEECDTKKVVVISQICADDLKKVKIETLQNCDVEIEKLQSCEVEIENLKNCDIEIENLQNCDVEIENLQNCDVEIENLQNCDVEIDNSQNCDVEIENSQNWDATNINSNIDNLQHAFTSITNNESNNSKDTAIVYGFKNIPIQVTGSWKTFEKPDNYTRGCKWAPDGSCILTCSNDNRLRIFNLPQVFYEGNFDWSNVQEMQEAIEFHDGGSTYDFAWYPHMTSYDPVTCCFCSSSKDNPVHMWDAFTGQLRATYRPYNHVDEIASPHSVSFDAMGHKLYCGFYNAVRIFDVAIPGRDCILRKVYTKKEGGQNGIISCFAFSPVNENISAAGSYGKTVGIYSEPSGYLEHILPANSLGVTQILFSPDGTKLYSGGRNNFEILCWDLRNLSTVLFALRRQCVTNQKMQFDVSKCGKYVVTGNQNGIVTIWDTTKNTTLLSNDQHPVLEPVMFYQAHSDCVNGVSLHPTMAVLATCSGQRKFPDPVDLDDETNSMFNYKNITRDNSLRLWWTSD